MDNYTWRASYGDNDHLDEADAATGFSSVDQSRLKHLHLLNVEGAALHVVAIPGGAQAVFFRRRQVVVNFTENGHGPRGPVHCIGWKKDEEAVYLFIFEDGSTLLTDDLQAA